MGIVLRGPGGIAAIDHLYQHPFNNGRSSLAQRLVQAEWAVQVAGLGARLVDAARWVTTPGGFSAIIALIVVLAAGLFADQQNRDLHLERLRADVQGELSLVRARLEGKISGNVQLVRGLVAVISAEPEMSAARFERLAEATLSSGSQLRHVAAAPDMVVTMIYPRTGNEAAMGLDLATHPGQRESALRARDSGEMVLAGPVELVQGGAGLIGRFPVLTQAGAEPARFWGIVSAVIDLDRLYDDSGVTALARRLDLAIVGADGRGAAGAQFYGPPDIIGDAAVSEAVHIPGGTWQLLARPRGGWPHDAENAVMLRFLIALAGLAVIVPILVSGRLLDERQLHVSALRGREIELKRLSQRLELALATSKVGVWEYYPATRELVWDGRMNELYCLPVDGHGRRYEDWSNALHPDDLARARAEFDAAVAGGGEYRSQFRVRAGDDTIRHVRAIGGVFEHGGGTTKMVGVNWDVSSDMALTEDLQRAKHLAEARNAELETAKANIEHNALHDPLTGLPNRRYLDAMLARIASQPDDGRRLALLHIDLDRFKQINDTLGHAAGDAMLVHAARVLASNVRSEDFVARIGGDEFVVLCQAEGGDAVLAALAERIVVQMRVPVDYRGHECRFGVSVGIASEPARSADAGRLLINADIALYRAKRRGRNRYEFFTAALQAEVINTKRMADDILKGLERNEFVPFFQPQFDAWSLDVTGVEALVRWHHPTEGLLAPGRFLAVAEELNVVAMIDRMVLEQSLSWFSTWRKAGIAVPRLSVNVSARRLQDETLVESLRHLEIAPGTLSFELVESIFLDTTEDIVSTNIERIKQMGIDIEIDDFGTGYASIVSLLKLKPSRLKIDRQLVMPIVDSPAQRHLVGSIIDIGKSLDIGVVGEGTETMAHAAVLRALGCDVLQGYALARPMPGEEIAGFVTAGRWRPASRMQANPQLVTG
jgi:diguanylate cyclase (GGDEF)-like protein